MKKNQKRCNNQNKGVSLNLEEGGKGAEEVEEQRLNMSAE